MRYVVLVCVLSLLCVQSAGAAGNDELAKLKAKVEQLEAENKSLKEQVAKLMEKLAAQKKPAAKTEVVIDYDELAVISIGEKIHTLTSLRQEFASAPPSQVVVRYKNKDRTTIGSITAMTTFLTKAGLTKDVELGNEEIWVREASPAKKP